jgi:ribosomal-protein-alanine N-acetyltransferase
MAEGLVRAARRAEVKRLFLEVAADNDAAITLYEGLGFKIAGARKAYYQRKGSANVDAVILALDL